MSGDLDYPFLNAQFDAARRALGERPAGEPVDPPPSPPRARPRREAHVHECKHCAARWDEDA